MESAHPVKQEDVDPAPAPAPAEEAVAMEDDQVKEETNEEPSYASAPAASKPQKRKRKGRRRGGGDEEGSAGGRERFLLELEFVQSLANPNYVHYLAQHRYFDNPTFVKYLKYLRYWKRPEYSRFLVFPHSLYFLDLLQTEAFRTAMAYPHNKEFVHKQQFYFWQHYRANRMKALRPPEEQTAATASTVQ
eukprot:jgi/Chlat1/1887/Chrsp145S00770